MSEDGDVNMDDDNFAAPPRRSLSDDGLCSPGGAANRHCVDIAAIKSQIKQQQQRAKKGRKKEVCCVRGFHRSVIIMNRV